MKNRVCGHHTNQSLKNLKSALSTSAKSDIYFAALFYLDYINDLNLLEKKLLREFDMLKLFLRKLEILSIFK